MNTTKDIKVAALNVGSTVGALPIKYARDSRKAHALIAAMVMIARASDHFVRDVMRRTMLKHATDRCVAAINVRHAKTKLILRSREI